MDDKDLADFLRKRWDGKDVIYSKENLPEPNPRHSQVTLYTDKMKKFRDHMAELQIFAAQVCEVEPDDLCLMDMWKFLMKRHGIKLSAICPQDDL